MCIIPLLSTADETSELFDHIHYVPIILVENYLLHYRKLLEGVE